MRCFPVVLVVLMVSFVFVSCENLMFFDSSRRKTSNREALSLRGPVRSLSIFQAALIKKDDNWEPQEEVPVRVERFDRRGNITERLSYNPSGAVRERAVFSYDERGREIEVQRYGVDSRLVGHAVSTHNEYGDRAELRLYSSTDVLTERTAFQHDADGKEVAAHTYTREGELKNRTSTRYDASGNIEEKHWYSAADVLARKAVYHRDFQGTLVRLVTYDYEADSRLRRRADVVYNNNGDPTESLVYMDSGTVQRKERFTYRYDAFGNWTAKTTKQQVLTQNASYFTPSRIILRIFEYYERGRE